MGAEQLLSRLETLVHRLRSAGVAVPTGAHLDAVHALTHLPLDDVAALRGGLRATLVKQRDDDATFDRLFARTILATAKQPGGADGDDDQTGSAAAGHDHHGGPGGLGGLGPPDQAAMRQQLADAMRFGDPGELQRLAALAVETFAGLADEGSDRYHLHRTLRALDLANMLGGMLRDLRRDSELSEFELGLQRSELRQAFEDFRRMLAEEIAKRRPAHPDPLDGALPGAQDGIHDGDRPADRPLLEMSALELAELRRVVQPLARQLAARIARRRRARLGPRVDIRRTIRRSLDTGGVPLDVVTRRPHPHRPDVVVLCDVSGSVAPFAQFTFMLVNALHDELRVVRSFAFVDGIAEVSDVFEAARYELHVSRLIERRGVVGLDGHSDYGQVLEMFVDRHLDAISPRTTVLICGDARSNYRPHGAQHLATIAKQARAVYWLNPEPEAEWGDADSVIEVYRQYCRGVFETRTLRQIADVIGQLV